MVSDVYGVHVSFGLQVVERQFESCKEKMWATHERLTITTRYVYKVGSVMFGNKTKETDDSVSVTFVVDTNSANTTDPTLYTYLVYCLPHHTSALIDSTHTGST